MPITPFDAPFAGDATRQIGRATVVALLDDGGVAVAGAGSDPLRCDVLLTSGDAPRPLVVGQAVLVWDPGVPGERGVVLGRIGGAPAPAPAPHPAVPVAHPPLASTLPAPRVAADPDAVPESLVVEARHALTLRVGDGSITLHADGRILIQGQDLVSSARRLNRIKGGAISIN